MTLRPAAPFPVLASSHPAGLALRPLPARDDQSVALLTLGSRAVSSLALILQTFTSSNSVTDSGLRMLMDSQYVFLKEPDARPQWKFWESKPWPAQHQSPESSPLRHPSRAKPFPV